MNRAALLLILGVVPYLNTLWNGLVYDDQYQIVRNPFIRSFHFVGTIFTTSVWAFQVKQGLVAYYRPLMTFSYLLLYRLFGPIPYVYHLLNVSLNCAVVVMLFLLVRRLSRLEPIAWVAAAWFALHPIHTEVVAWVASVPDLQMTFFLLCSFWFYLNATERSDHRLRNLLVACGFFVLALLSKEPAVMFPAILLLYELLRFLPRKSGDFRKLALCESPFWALAVVYLYGRFFLLSGIAPNTERANMPFRDVVESAFSLFGSYMTKLVWPGPAGAAYRFHATSSLEDPRFLIGAAWACAMALGFGFLWRARRTAALGLAWIVIFLLPVLDAKVMASNVFAERYLYLPSVGFCWIVGELAVLSWRNVSKRRWAFLRIGVAVAGMGAVSFATYAIIRRNAVWHDERRLYEAMLRQDPANPTAHADLGAMYWNSGLRKQAEDEWLTAVAIDPKSIFALDNLGIAATYDKRYSDAIEYLQRAIAARPGFPKAHAHLAAAFAAAGDTQNAEKQFRKSLELSPFDVEARNDYAKFCLANGRTTEALAQYRISLSVTPTTEPLQALGTFALEGRDFAAAQKFFSDAIALDPYESQAHFGLAKAYVGLGDNPKALREYQLGLENDPRNDSAQNAVARLKSTQ